MYKVIYNYKFNLYDVYIVCINFKRLFIVNDN